MLKVKMQKLLMKLQGLADLTITSTGLKVKKEKAGASKDLVDYVRLHVLECCFRCCVLKNQQIVSVEYIFLDIIKSK